MKRIMSLVLCGLSGLSVGWSADHDGHHGSLGPVGVSGTHLHPKGEWMVTLKQMEMRMKGNSDGGRHLEEHEVLADYMVAPKTMSMRMTMLGVMAAPDDDLTLMLMIPWIEKSMKHTNRMFRDFTTRSTGIGDIQLTGLVPLRRDEHGGVHAHLGVSLPTGSTDVKDDTLPGSLRGRLPYPMQLGSGTWDLIAGLTWARHRGSWNLGAQTLETFRIGKNRHHYRLGDRYTVTTWAGRNLTDSLESTVRLKWSLWRDTTGRDRRLNPRMVPTADTNRRSGKRIDLLAGLNWNPDDGHTLSLEGGLPVMESLDGPQLSTEFLWTAAWRIRF